MHLANSGRLVLPFALAPLQMVSRESSHLQSGISVEPGRLTLSLAWAGWAHTDIWTLVRYIASIQTAETDKK